ncbi:FMN-dependent dehydrogenase, partial [Mycena maculata]
GGKLANPAGKVLITKVAAERNILHWACNMAGCTKEELAAARSPGQTQFWQIYAMSDLDVTAREIKQAIALGCKGFALTVDGVYMGKRERDLRLAAAQSGDDDEEGGGGVSAQRSPLSLKFSWTTVVEWLRSLTDLPIAVKAIQTHEDAALRLTHGVQGVCLSNHGGRQLEGRPSATETLVSIRKHFPTVFDKCEVIVDGGVTRGTSVVKALALGATAAGIGRPFLFALPYGQAGVRKAIEIMYKEVETTMALLGVTVVDQLRPEHVRSYSCFLSCLYRLIG